MDEGDLLVTLAVSLGAAGLGAVAAGLLRQSVALGYVVAGVLIGPHTPGFVADEDAVIQLADIGIILIMFTIGVQLSMRELLRTGPVAVGGGIAQVLFIMAVGYGVGQAMGWGSLESLFFGAIISNSSSTVMGKLLTERGESDSVHGRIGIAWSSVQDLGTVAMVVVFTALAEDNDAPLHQELGVALLIAGVYFALLVPAGVFLLPKLFEWIARVGSREVFILAATAVALGTAYAASLFGVSIALGAFVAGMVVARSDLAHQVLGEITPLRDIFAGLFFVSVGMLFSPTIALQNWEIVLVTVGLIVVVKGGFAALITSLGGFRARTAVLSGVVLAQSGEFSFLLARLGFDLEVLSEDVFGIVVAAAVISIVVLPLLYKAGRPAGAFAEHHWKAGRATRQEQEPPAEPMSGHAILCGFGRVGRVIEQALRANGVDYAVVDQDIHIISDLRGRGVPALYGSASNPVLLEQAGLERARVLIVAIPDPVSARQIVEHARRVNPWLDIVVRTHSDAERELLRERGVNEAVVGELELALEMSRHALRRFGATETEAEETLRSIRGSS